MNYPSSMVKYFILTITSALAAPAYGYKETTHQLLSIEAANSSVLSGSNSILSDLNLPALTAATADYRGSDNILRNAQGIIAFGAANEDDEWISRALNHFYDPQYQNFLGRGLSVGTNVGRPSPAWAIEDGGETTELITGRVQNWSYRAAEQDYYAALTGPTATARAVSLANMFQSLGQVIHHVQDMGQPQHARNVIHPSGFLGGYYESYTLAKFGTQSLLHNFLGARGGPCQFHHQGFHLSWRQVDFDPD